MIVLKKKNNQLHSNKNYLFIRLTFIYFSIDLFIQIFIHSCIYSCNHSFFFHSFFLLISIFLPSFLSLSTFLSLFFSFLFFVPFLLFPTFPCLFWKPETEVLRACDAICGDRSAHAQGSNPDGSRTCVWQDPRKIFWYLYNVFLFFLNNSPQNNDVKLSRYR